MILNNRDFNSLNRFIEVFPEKEALGGGGGRPSLFSSFSFWEKRGGKEGGGVGKGLGQEESSFPQNGALLRAAVELMRAAVSARRPSPSPLSRVLARHPRVRPSATASSARTHLHSRTRGRRTSTKGKSQSAAAAFSPPSAAAGSGCSTSMPSAAVASSADMLRPPAFTFPSRLLPPRKCVSRRGVHNYRHNRGEKQGAAAAKSRGVTISETYLCAWGNISAREIHSMPDDC